MTKTKSKYFKSNIY